MERARQEPAAPRAVRICRVCVDPLRSPAALEPCGHVFCHACIQPRAAPDAAATCPICREPIGAIRLLQGQDNRAALAPRRRRLHPFVARWRQRQQQEQQQEAAAGGRWHQRFSNGPPLCPASFQRVLEELDRNGPDQDGPLWLLRERRRRAGLRGPPAPPPLVPI